MFTLKLIIVLLLATNVISVLIIKSLMKELKFWQKDALEQKAKFQRLATRYAPKE